MFLDFPTGHKPRFENFELAGFLDETMREGAERCPFSIPAEKKLKLARKISDCGVRDIVFGSAPSDPELMQQFIEEVKSDNPQSNIRLAFILLLNCWEPLYDKFRSFPKELMDNVCISFGMIDYKSNEQLFQRVFHKFHDLGFRHFRVSLINNFKSGVDEATYTHITRQIDASVSLGIDTVRINDSLGVCYPETMAVLAANLVHSYPRLNFCVHAHDDKGLGLQNAMTSIYNGFNLIEGGFSGFGNRSGLPAVEVLEEIFSDKNIRIQGMDLDPARLRQVGYLAEETFLVVPNVYRAVTGKIVNWENLGVANIPDYLGDSRRARRFLTDVGTHDGTLNNILETASESNKSQSTASNNALSTFRESLHEEMANVYEIKRELYSSITESIGKLYSEGVIFEEDAIEKARRFVA
ncbi:MAG: hypothetical protein JJU21_15845 [Salinarimonas sp.]|nr:hypothetical protein [Salinarimonas sp.]